ncbi:MAG: FeoB small GTPase domain-containing protein, partial [Desulfohalobiaceae bacterium]
MFQPFGNRKEETDNGPTPGTAAASDHRIVLVGSPNVGKSVLFANLTGYYATVSNYPGTTVSIAESSGQIEDFAFDLVDTPGMYSFLPLTEEERVTRRILQQESFDKVIHVVDAKNLDRSLMLTFQLIEAGLPVILVLNMMDEARAKGLDIDTAELEDRLGIPVVGSVCTTGEGMDVLRKRIREDHPRNRAEKSLQAFGRFETYVQQIPDLLAADFRIAARSVALLLLQGDREIQDMVREREPEAHKAISAVL